MQARTLIALTTVVVGFILAVVSYFFLAAPLGQPINESFSNPRVPFAGGLFVLGILLIFGSAVIYELYPERRSSAK